jgi:hypothetical protein
VQFRPIDELMSLFGSEQQKVERSVLRRALLPYASTGSRSEKRTKFSVSLRQKSGYAGR